MAEFDRDYLEMFLGVVRKYMQVRGALSQKDLAELSEVGVSTMSRFLNQKTNELNPQLLGKIVAKLNIPLHEIIDFVDESYTEKFIRLVKFYKGEDESPGDTDEGYSDRRSSRPRRTGDERRTDGGGDAFVDTLSELGTADRKTEAKVSAGNSNKKRKLVFESDNDAKNSRSSIRDKLETLSPRQKAYMSDFLDLDMEGRDLMVDLGNSLFRYFRQKGVEL